jgi:hypothetical protein
MFTQRPGGQAGSTAPFTGQRIGFAQFRRNHTSRDRVRWRLPSISDRSAQVEVWRNKLKGGGVPGAYFRPVGVYRTPAGTQTPIGSMSP